MNEVQLRKIESAARVVPFPDAALLADEIRRLRAELADAARRAGEYAYWARWEVRRLRAALEQIGQGGETDAAVLARAALGEG